MLIIVSLSVLIMLVLFSLILGTDLIDSLTSVGIDNTAIINGSSTTYVVSPENIIFQIDTSSLITAGIALLATIIIIATITGIQVVGSGLSPASVRIFIILTGYVGIWTTLSLLAFDLIFSIQVFGSVIYISLTLVYTIGVINKITGSDN